MVYFYLFVNANIVNEMTKIECSIEKDFLKDMSQNLKKSNKFVLKNCLILTGINN